MIRMVDIERKRGKMTENIQFVLLVVCIGIMSYLLYNLKSKKDISLTIETGKEAFTFMRPNNSIERGITNYIFRKIHNSDYILTIKKADTNYDSENTNPDKENLDKAFWYLKQNDYFKDIDVNIEVAFLNKVSIDKIQFYNEGELVEERVPELHNGFIYALPGDQLTLRAPRDRIDFAFDLKKGERARILEMAKSKDMTYPEFIEHKTCQFLTKMLEEEENGGG